jgi:hypothetical protein
MGPDETERATQQGIDITPTDTVSIPILPAEPRVPEPPVTDAPEVLAAAAAEPVTASRSSWFRVGVRPLWVALLIVGLAIAIGATGWWASGVLAQVDRTKTAIADARAHTDSTKADTSSAISATGAEQAATEKANKDADHQQAVSTQASVCISAQAGDDDAVRAMLDKQRANSDLTAVGSKFRTADTAIWKYLATAIDYMENSYKAVVAGNISSANGWVSKSNAQVKTEDTQLKAINRTVDQINGERDALSRSLEQTGQDCDL